MMKWILALVMIVGLQVLGGSSFAKEDAKEEKVPEVEKWYHGFYVQYFKKITFFYSVDTKTQICFANRWVSTAAGGGPISTVQITCSDLAKREEWKPILTWVK